MSYTITTTTALGTDVKTVKTIGAAKTYARRALRSEPAVITDSEGFACWLERDGRSFWNVAGRSGEAIWSEVVR